MTEDKRPRVIVTITELDGNKSEIRGRLAYLEPSWDGLGIPGRTKLEIDPERDEDEDS